MPASPSNPLQSSPTKQQTTRQSAPFPPQSHVGCRQLCCEDAGVSEYTPTTPAPGAWS
jgi:hypothetical protein